MINNVDQKRKTMKANAITTDAPDEISKKHAAERELLEQ